MSLPLQDEEARHRLLELESERCRAIAACDIDALRHLIAEELIHVHLSGKEVGKEEFMAGILAVPRKVVRGPLKIGLFDGFAIMTGVQTNLMDGKPPANMAVTQVWVLREPGWQQVSFHCSPLTPAA